MQANREGRHGFLGMQRREILINIRGKKDANLLLVLLVRQSRVLVQSCKRDLEEDARLAPGSGQSRDAR